MSQYLVAVWDYVSEGEYELSFKQGDRIKLLERHNDDWYVYLWFMFQNAQCPLSQALH